VADGRIEVEPLDKELPTKTRARLEADSYGTLIDVSIAKKRAPGIFVSRRAVDAEGNTRLRIPAMEVAFVGRLTRSLPLSRPDGLPVYVARVPGAPFCEMLILA
jgi:hypothetical protein